MVRLHVVGAHSPTIPLVFGGLVGGECMRQLGIRSKRSTSAMQRRFLPRSDPATGSRQWSNGAFLPVAVVCSERLLQPNGCFR